MTRRLLKLLTLPSVVLFVAVVALWVWSYTSAWQWAVGSFPGTKWEVRSGRGWLSVERTEILFLPAFRDGNLWAMRSEERYRPGGENPTGIYFHRDEGLFRKRLPGEERPALPALERFLPKQTWCYESKVGVSYPLLGLITLAPPAVWLWRRRAWIRRQRIEAGLCPACAYDLRATPARCPECGNLSPAPTPA
jgi:hypothetical protein